MLSFPCTSADKRWVAAFCVVLSFLLGSCAVSNPRSDKSVSTVDTDLLMATPAEFCQEAQRIVSRTDRVGEVTVHPEFYAFVQSKTSIEPLMLHVFVWTDESGRAVAISCKLKSADHLNVTFGDNTAGPDGLCQDMNRETLRQVQSALSMSDSRKVIFDARENVFNEQNPPRTGRDWLEPFPLAYEDTTGALHIRTKGFRVDWTDPRFADMDGRVRGVHYCHFIAPDYLRDLLLGRVGPGATVGRVILPAVASSTAEAPTADTLRYSTTPGAEDVPINIVEAGRVGAPGILFIHGFSQTHLSFDAQLRDPALANRFHLVAFDLRGHGNSGKPWDAEDYSSQFFADDVKAVMRATGLKQPIVVGWSFGGLVAMHYVRHYGTDNISGLNLVGTTGRLFRVPPSGTAEPNETIDSDWVQLTLSNSVADNLKAAAGHLDLMTTQPMPEEWRKRTLAAAMTMPAYAKRAIGADPRDNADLAGKIRVPVLFSAGARDPISPLSKVLATSTMVPGTRTSVYAESGHSPFAEEPERFNRELVEFARELEILTVGSRN